jgi:hypothetical protein
MSAKPEVLFEGFTEAEILALPKEQVEALIIAKGCALEIPRRGSLEHTGAGG